MVVCQSYEPTCTEDGVLQRMCLDCGYKTEREVLPATGHDYEAFNMYECALCGEHQTWTVTYKVDGEIVKTIELIYNDAYGVPSDPVKEGQTFAGWYYENTNDQLGSRFDAFLDAKDVVFEARFGEVVPVTYAEVAVEEGELVAGNRYRIYRGELFYNQLILSCFPDDMYLFAPALDCLYADKNVFMDGPRYIVSGMEIVETEDYVDFYFAEGTYYIDSEDDPSSSFIIDEMTTISFFSAGKVFRLEPTTEEASVMSLRNNSIDTFAETETSEGNEGVWTPTY